MFMSNPEFKKNYLLEVNLTRLIVCFGLIGLFASTLYFPYHESGLSPGNDYRHAEKFFNTFCGIGFFFSIIWGTYLSASSIGNELQQKTWDFVRMSSLSPLKILFGKLFGATSLIWIVTLGAILPVLAYQAAELLNLQTLPFRNGLTTATVFITSIILWVILSHAGSMVFSLQATLLEMSKERTNNILVTLLITVGGLFIGGYLMFAFDQFHRNPTRTGTISPPSDIEWYGHDIYNLDAILLCLAVATFWTVMGAYQTLRQSLQFRDVPIVWALFLFTTSIFLNGFLPDMHFELLLIWPIAITICSMGVMALVESRDIVRYKTFWARFQNSQYHDALRYIPLWIISFGGLVISLALSIIFVDHRASTIASIISLICVIIRDLLVLHWIVWKPNVKRPLLGYFVYGAVVYWILPLLFHGEPLFYPLLPGQGTEAPMYWIMQFVFLLVAGWLFLKRWNTAFKAEATPPVLSVQP